MKVSLLRPGLRMQRTSVKIREAKRSCGVPSYSYENWTGAHMSRVTCVKHTAQFYKRSLKSPVCFSLS